MKENNEYLKRNLCDTCIKHIAECDAREVNFGTGIGNDNIIDCDSYKVDLKPQQEKVNNE